MYVEEGKCFPQVLPNFSCHFTVFLLFPGSVFAVAVNPLSTVAVSGGEDDKGFLWKLSNQELLFECTGTAHDTVYADVDCASVVHKNQICL